MWDGSRELLAAAINLGDIARLIVFDTWTRNCDRYPADIKSRKPNHDNVFLSAEGAPKGKFILKAIDHTHCFDCGRELNAALNHIDKVKDPRVFGLFPEFHEIIGREAVAAAAERLAELTRPAAEAIVGSIANDWAVPAGARAALCDLIVDRAQYVAGTITQSLFPSDAPPKGHAVP